MRVLLMRRKRTERGAIAVIVGLLATALLVMGALVVDFGMAYVNKNRAQEAADAGALAVGKIYADAKAYCNATGGVTTPLPLSVNPLTEAEEISTANLPGSTSGGLDIICESEDPGDLTVKTIKITYTVQADSPVGLGALVAGTDHITVARHASVKWGTSQKAVGSLRPWMICGGQVTMPLQDKVVEIGYPTNGHKPPPAGSCGADRGGDWWRTSCFNPDGHGGGSHGTTEQNVLVGCSSIQIVPGQPTGAAATPTAISAKLRSACSVLKTPGEKPYCLGDDTGHDVSSLDDEWDTLIGDTIAMPMFCDVPQCTPTSVPNDKKYNWPVWKIAAVTICGYALKGVYSTPAAGSALPTGDCNNKNTDHLDPYSFGHGDTGFLVIFKGIVEEGSETAFPVETKTTMRLSE